jgi:hypothetical protein
MSKFIKGRDLSKGSCFPNDWTITSPPSYPEQPGRRISDRILASDDSVEVHVHVGFAMMMYREPIGAAIEGSIDEYIARESERFRRRSVASAHVLVHTTTGRPYFTLAASTGVGLLF